MSLMVQSSTHLLGQLAQRFSGADSARSQYASNISFAQQIQAYSGQDAASKSVSVNELVKPSSGLFASLTGINESDAVSILHGVVGSRTDTRDWAAIMSADDPLAAARAATASMYGTAAPAGVVDAVNPTTGHAQVRSGAFAIETVQTSASSIPGQPLALPTQTAQTKSAVYLIDQAGQLLRHAGSSAQEIGKNAWLFGFDTQPLAKLADAVQTTTPALADQMRQASTASVRSVPGSQTAALPAVEVAPPATSASSRSDALSAQISKLLEEWLALQAASKSQ